ncbi:MAG TPA: ATP-binding cassette domain-containing protein [Pyrinomonadaceae bacterium]|nr:ATP-binding cassette domain-containing protein [Pyrinomonadaceae bacterium]
MPFRLFGRRRLLVPEVVQTSSMDCGPASLKCMLEGFGISASYGRLREACQTEVDGTSIDTMEEVAVQLGLEAEQVMIPVDHLLLPGSEPLPALVVVRRPPNATHFLVAWRRTGRFMQLMDPATGRRWVTASKFLEEVYVHTMPVAAEGWREWASSASFTGALSKRLAELGVGADQTKRLIDTAVKDEGWRRLAALDAATRMAESVVRSGGIGRGRQAAGVVERFAERAAGEGAEDWTAIPADFWSARPGPPDADGEEQVFLRGAVLVHVRGLRAGAKVGTVEGAAAAEEVVEGTRDKAQLPPELAAALEERPARPGLELLRILRADGLFSPLVLIFAVGLAAAGTVAEALMLRGLFDVGRELSLSGQRLGAVGALVVFLLALLVLELPVVNAVLRMGRRLETRLRMLFMDKIPRLGDRYFHSRLTSDMTERSHSIHVLRHLPALGQHFLRAIFSLLLTALGIAWLDPLSAPLALLAAALAVAVPLFAQPVLVERNLRVRNHAGALSRFYFDALIGLFAVRAHGAERAVRREHENLLIDWAGAGLGLLRATVTAEALHLVAGFGLSAWMLVGYVSRAGESGGLLLFAYWVLNLPVLGQEVGLVARQYPGFRNATLRMLEPLGALEETESDEPADSVVETKAGTEVAKTLEAGAQVELTVPKATVANALVEEISLAAETLTLDSASRAVGPNGDGHSPARGLPVVFEGVTVRAAGHTILEEISLSVDACEHVAVVGSSGAGKSSLVGILLGWHRPAAGRVYVGGESLGGRRLERLRRETAWVDPTVQLWNQTFIENLRYGSGASEADSLSRAVKLADLIDVLEKLPDGLQTPLGEGGALVSGGQGQRVRLGRAMLRGGARLVILDEPFRGLERDRRRRLLERARAYWRGATLLCITHDVGETLSFERVVVVDGGRVVEDGHPSKLASDPGSRYAALLAAEEEVRTGMWSGGEWRRLRLQGQRLS